MLNLALALYMNNIRQRQFAASIGMTEAKVSEIVSGKCAATEEQRHIIRKALGVRMSTEKLFSELDLGPKNKEYVSRFTPRKLDPKIQAQVDAAVALEVAKIRAFKAAEPKRLQELATKTAEKYFE